MKIMSKGDIASGYGTRVEFDGNRISTLMMQSQYESAGGGAKEVNYPE